MNRATSPIAIDGDRPLGRFAKLAYLGANAVRNIVADRPGALATARFSVGGIGAFTGTPSPSRLLCERHLAGFDWPSFAQAGGGIRMHEMGCGSGRAGRLVAHAAARPIGYRGFDVRANAAWATPMEGARMSVFDGSDFARTIDPSDNFFFSQSAAEHIPADLDYFVAVARACATAAGPTLQIHYLPAAACLRLYLFHGFRQYPAGALARLAALQPPGARCMAVALGGPASIALHWRWITCPLLTRKSDRRNVDPEGYRAALSAAIAADDHAPPAGPLFWAFVAETGI